jgi:hypothetical protein
VDALDGYRIAIFLDDASGYAVSILHYDDVGVQSQGAR